LPKIYTTIDKSWVADKSSRFDNYNIYTVLNHSTSLTLLLITVKGYFLPKSIRSLQQIPDSASILPPRIKLCYTETLRIRNFSQQNHSIRIFLLKTFRKSLNVVNEEIIAWINHERYTIYEVKNLIKLTLPESGLQIELVRTIAYLIQQGTTAISLIELS